MACVCPPVARWRSPDAALENVYYVYQNATESRRSEILALHSLCRGYRQSSFLFRRTANAVRAKSSSIIDPHAFLITRGYRICHPENKKKTVCPPSCLVHAEVIYFCLRR
ncbi:unnamed protein product [Ixodes pacificus]